MMGRPPLEVLQTDQDWETLYGLLKIQATIEECASYFDCSEDTLNRRISEKHSLTFAGLFKLKAGHGRVSLRRKQWQTALAGNPTMLIFLGKNHLGQADKMEHSGNESKPFQLAYTPKSQREKEAS